MPDCKVQKHAPEFMGAISAVISMLIFSSSSIFIARHFPSINLFLLSSSSHWCSSRNRCSPKSSRSSLFSGVIGLLLACCTASVNAKEFDYDGDGLADVAVRRASNQYWYIKNSAADNFNSERQDGIQRTQFGVQETDIPVAADYDGDGITDMAVRRPSSFTWYIRNSSGTDFNSDQGDNIQRIVFGRDSEDIPVPADYDGDGITDVAVRRSSNFTWYIRNSSGSNFNSSNGDGIQRVTFGRNVEDIPVKGDFNGDGIDDIAVRRASNFTWYIKNSNGDNYNSDSGDGIQRVIFGRDSGDIAVPADYDGDGITDIAVRRPSDFTWYILNSSDGEIQRIVFGRNVDDIPVPADYDGDGKADVAVRRDSNQFFYVLNSSDSEIQRINFGLQENDIPTNAPVPEIIAKLDKINAEEEPSNNAPVANAGTDIEVTVGETATLNGSRSSDVDGDSLSYQWSLTSSPDGSNADLSNAQTVSPTLTPDVTGAYVVALTVNDGTQNSVSDSVIITAVSNNSAPVANAGTDIEVAVGATATLNGSGSSDVDGDSLSYQWSLTNAPEGSSADLSNAQTVSPTFTPDVTGAYVVALTVNDGTQNSDVDFVTITAVTINSAPVANAGTDIEVTVGATATLDGSGSSDADGDSLFYQWSLTRSPEGSNADLSNTQTVSPTLMPDVTGAYVVALTVNDGTQNSVADFVNITAVTINIAPVANAGTDIEVDVGSIITLDGSASSDADGDTISYQWMLSSVPEGSGSVLNNPSSAMPSLTPDVVGTYKIDLIVNDGNTDSFQDSVIVTAVQPAPTINADFYAPEPIISRLGNVRNVTWTAINSDVTDLQRFVFGPAGSDDLFLLDDSNSQVAANLSLADALTAQNTVTDGTLLASMFKFIAIGNEDENGNGAYRIVSTKHSNYVLDWDDSSDNIILRDYRSGTRNDDTAAYLAFTISRGSSYTLQATGRWQYDTASGSFIEDPQWQSLNLIVSNDSLQLSAGVGSEFTLYSPPIDFDMPFDLNPEQTARVTNSEVTPETKDGDLDSTATQINSSYASQVSVQGNDGDTAAAALSALQEVSDTLQAQGSALRYPMEFYTAIREGFLKRIYISSDSTDGVLGQNTVPYVYFTNESDDDGVHHPFMVIASYNLPDSLTLLWDVPRPPGDGLGTSYDEEAVTRSIHKELLLMKIPLRDYGEVESLTENSMENDLATDVGQTNYDHHNYASTSSSGVAIDGVLIYPSYNNRLHISQSEAELSAHGMHSGRGLGAHYHADAYSANDKGLNLYNTEDYEGHSHPPIITIGFDGIAGYGIYKDNQGDGIDVALDEFGGHEHGDYGYHYHSWPEDAVTDSKGINYTAHQLPPLGAWAGRINDIPEFWSGTKPNVTGGRSKWLGNE